MPNTPPSRVLTLVTLTLALALPLAVAPPSTSAQTPPPATAPREPAPQPGAEPGEPAPESAAPVAGRATAPGRYTVTPASSAIRVDAVLDEPAWAAALTIPLRYEWFPGDNTPPPVETEALLTFDENNVYVAFRCFDPRPQEIRANLMDRDSINTFVQDDHVSFMFDPFDDERRAFQFRVNPLGVQADALFSQVEFIEDFSWDIIWESAGRITDDGYVVEVAIPVNQLRFPASSGPQTWGVELARSYPRSVRHRLAANPRDRANNCLLCQIDKVTGFEGMARGRNLEVVPTLTATRQDVRESFPHGPLEGGDEELEPGITARWGLSPSLTLNATVNPDFSQVEADVAQLAVNQRFALFFPEKRPFFLEGVDFFATPIEAVFTRTVVDPEWGLKLTGKQGRNAGGAFVTRDEVNSLLIPANQQSSLAFLEQTVDAAVLRYRRDLGANSTVGFLYTGREGDGYRNHVAGLDGFVRISPTDELRFQVLRSDTLYPHALATAFGQSLDAFTGEALRLTYNHQERSWFANVSYDDLDPGFRADSGFVPRVDVRDAQAGGGYVWYGEQGRWWHRFQLSLNGGRTEDHAGQLTDERLDLAGLVQGPRQSLLQVSVENNTELFGGTLYRDMRRAEAYFEMQPGPVGKVTAYVDHGETVDYSNNRPADIVVFNPGVELKLGRHVNLQASHVLQRLDVDGGELSEANLSQLRLVYNFSVRSFVRGIAQYTDLTRDPDLFLAPVPRDSEQLFTQLLYSYKLNPQTVLFVGYSDTHLGETGLGLTQAGRTFFFKVGYAWIM